MSSGALSWPVPSGFDSVFPWDVVSSDPAAPYALLRFYGVQLGDLVPGVAADFEARVLPGGSGFGCVHVAPTGVPAMAPRQVDRCDPCTQAVRALVESGSSIALDAAASLAHWSRWLEITRSPAAAVILEGVLGNVVRHDVTDPLDGLPDEVVRVIESLMDRASGLLAVIPPGFDPDAWTLAGSMSGALEGALTWMYAASCGASAGQCHEAVRWANAGPVTSRVRAAEELDRDRLAAGAFLVSDPFLHGQWVDWCEPTLYQRLVTALDLPMQRALRALTAEMAVALSEVLRVGLDRHRLLLVPASDLDSRVPVRVDARVAHAASRLWVAAGPTARSSAKVSFMASPVDCIEAVCVLADAGALDSAVFDTALALAPEWFSPGRDLARAVLALE